jgi:DNA-binding transcriptional LysR family regulator
MKQLNYSDLSNNVLLLEALVSLSLRQLSAFVAIARLGSFTRAATQLHLSQPALTVQIRELEAALGVRVLDRSTRAVSLTPMGRELLPTLERVLADLATVVVNSRELAERSRGIVRIAALPSISATLLPDIIAKFRRRFPGITVHLRDCVATTVATLVRAGEVDLGISSLARTDAAIRVTPFMSDRMEVLMPATHPLQRARTVALKEVVRHPLILMDTASSVRMVLERAFEAAGLVVSPAYEAAYIATAVGMVKAGLGITILPSSAVDHRAMTGLKARAIADGALQRDIGVLEKVGRSRTPAAESFIDTLAAARHRVR